jgi:group I intron endonuclease
MITNLINGKIYIGKTTKTIEKRWQGHCYDKSDDYFHNAIRKYKPENFDIKQIDNCIDEEYQNFMEKLWIFLYDSTNRLIGYNIREGGKGGFLSEETKKKMSENHADVNGENNPFFGKHHSAESIEKMSIVKIGKVASVATKEKLSIIHSGENNSFFGKHHSAESIEKMSIAKIGKKMSEETKTKLSIANTGKHHSEETKKKISEFLTGKPKSDEAKKKISENHADVSGENNPMFGKHHSDEAKKKISKANSGLSSGEKNCKAKLTWVKVNEIRYLYKTGVFTKQDLADKFGVSKCCINDIIVNRTWKIKE